MKKLIVIILAILLFGCTAEKQDLSYIIVNWDNEVMYAVCDYISDKDINDQYQLADGIVAADCSDMSNIRNGSSKVFPIYCNDDIEYLLLQSGDEITVEPISEKVKKMFEENCTIVQIGDSVYAVADSNIVRLFGEGNGEDDMRKLRKINAADLLASKLNNNKKEVFHSQNGTVMIEGIEVSNRRISIKFKEGDVEQFVEQYQQFCNGTLHSSLITSGIYVFEFEQLSATKLNQLIEQSKQLPYVEEVIAEKVNHADNGVKPVLVDK